MSKNPNPIIYNKENIEDWENKLTQQKEIINNNLKIIQDTNVLLNPLQEKLRLLQEQINFLQAQINNAQIYLVNGSHCHNNYYSTYHHSYNGCQTISSSFIVGNTISMKLELSNKKIEFENLRQKMLPHEQAIDEASNKVIEAQKQVAWVSEHIKAGNQFLEDLIKSPKKLVDKLSEQILLRFLDYENNHPALQPPKVQWCLHNYDEKIDVLCRVNQLESTKLYPDLFQNDRISYLRLCQLLWDIYNHVKEEDQIFAEILFNLIMMQTHVAENGTLPDDLNTEKTAKQFFDECTKLHSNLFLTEMDFLKLQPKLLEQEINEIYPFLKDENILQKKIKIVVQHIKDEVKEKPQDELKFYTTIVRELRFLAGSTDDQRRAQRVSNLAEHAIGVPSVGKKVWGSLAVVAGVLICGASIGAIIATAGGSSFLSSFGMAVGSYLIASSFGFSIGMSITAGLGAGLVFFGVNKIKSGMRQGLSKELKEVETAAKYSEPESKSTLIMAKA